MWSQKVQEFTKACHDSLPNTPSFAQLKDLVYLHEMVNDELAELFQAQTEDEQADALVDAIYYILDFAARHGYNLDPVFDIVHSANEAKVVDGKVIRRADGKILKPKGWQDPKPLLVKEIERQKAEGGFK